MELAGSTLLPSRVLSNLNLTKAGSEPRGGSQFSTEVVLVYPQLTTLSFREAEVLHHYITTAVAAAPAPIERTAPNPSSFQLGGQQAASGATQQAQPSDPLFSGSPFANTGAAGETAERPLIDEAIAPDVSATSSRKVAGVY